MVTVDRLSFRVGSGCQVRQLCLVRDRAALAALAARCRDYLRLVFNRPVSATAAPDLLLRMLRPSRVPAERSFVMGIYLVDHPTLSPDALQGVLYFLHPPAGSLTWYLTLLLLASDARGKGLGTEIHRSFARWAVTRGSRRLVVAVARNNPRALHFWRDHLQYGEAPGLARSSCSTKPDNQNLERYLDPAPAWNG